MLRDTYHDFVEMQELMEAGPQRGAALVEARLDHLALRSGAKNVSNGILTVTHDPSRMVDEYSVSFSSRAWTGEDLHI